MKLIDGTSLKIKLGKRYSNDERRIREIFKETINDMPTIEAIPIEWLIEYGKKRTINIRDIFIIIDDWRKENENNIGN